MNGRSQTLITALIGIVIVVILIWVGVSRREEQVEPEPQMDGEEESIKVGWMGPLTGDAAAFGASIRRGVELAAKELGDENIELIFEDTKCEPRDATAAVNKLINVDDVQAIIGEVCSGATLAAAPVANENQIPMISASSTSPDLTTAGDYIFRTVPSDALQGAFGAQLVAAQGNSTLAVLYSNEEYGLGFNQVLEEEFPNLGGEVVASEAFERGAVDMRTQLTKIAAANPDAIYIISNSPDAAVAALQQIEELGIESTVYGSEGLKDEGIAAAAGAAIEGLIVTAVSSGTEDFVARHNAEYGEDPGPFAAQGYDAFKALYQAISSGAATGESIEQALRAVSFEGESGAIDFDENGDVLGNYNVFEVEGGEFLPAEG